MSLRRRIETSQFLTGLLAGLLAAYLRLCRATIRWAPSDLAALRAATAAGPVFVVCWHARLFGAVAFRPDELRDSASLRDPSPAGNLSAMTQERLGMTALRIGRAGSNYGAVRAALAAVRRGVHLGMTPDGPRGPARRAKGAAIEWARAVQRPVVLYAWSARPAIRLGTWDRLLVPLPFARGVFAYRPWDETVPRDAPKQELGRLRRKLGRDLDALTAEVDALAGRRPDPPLPSEKGDQH